MKIACIIHSLDGGGAERVMSALASRLAVRGHDVTLITLDDAKNDRHHVDEAVARRPLDLMRESRSLSEKLRNTRRRIRAIREAIEEIQSDVLLSFCDRTNILVLKAMARRGVPIVISERSDPALQKLGAFWELQRRKTYRHADRVVALTETSASNLRALGGGNVVVIPSAVDTPPSISDRACAMKHQRIVGIGRLEHEKGFDRLIEAFSWGRSSYDEWPLDWTLRILGEGTQREALRQLACELHVDHLVTMPGWVRPIWSELAEATIFALPSRYEGFPSALLEAMAVGVPSLAVDCESGPRAIITDETDGLLVKNSISGLADGMQRMIVDADLRERLGEQGKSVVQRFHWDAMVDAYEAVLQEVVKKRADP